MAIFTQAYFIVYKLNTNSLESSFSKLQVSKALEFIFQTISIDENYVKMKEQKELKNPYQIMTVFSH